MTERDAAPSAETWYGSEAIPWPKLSELVPENPSPAWQELIAAHANRVDERWDGTYWEEYDKLQGELSKRTEWGPVCVKLTYWGDRIRVTLTDTAEGYITQERDFTREAEALDLFQKTADVIELAFGRALMVLGWKSDSDA